MPPTIHCVAMYVKGLNGGRAAGRADHAPLAAPRRLLDFRLFGGAVTDATRLAAFEELRQLVVDVPGVEPFVEVSGQADGVPGAIARRRRPVRKRGRVIVGAGGDVPEVCPGEITSLAGS